MDKCPKCGADKTPPVSDTKGEEHFECSLYAFEDGKIIETLQCLRNQLAQANKRYDKLADAAKLMIEDFDTKWLSVNWAEAENLKALRQALKEVE